MSDRFGGWLALVLLALLAALTFWLDQLVQPALRTPSGIGRQGPDYIVDGLSAVRMDKQGRVKHTLRAQKMTHFPDEDITVLVEPHLVTYSEGRAPITVTSRDARMSGNGENVYFERQVRVVRAALSNQSELVLETDYLHVIPDENIAKTDRAVTVRNANAVINASGLELNSETRVLQMQGRVKGTYTRPGTPQPNAR